MDNSDNASTTDPVIETPRAEQSAPDMLQPMKFRKDYQPFGWLVPEVYLDFDLKEQETHVEARLVVSRNEAAEAEDTIRLNGDGLRPVRVTLDGEDTDRWEMDGDDLLISLPANVHEIAFTTVINPAENSQLMGLYASGGMLCTQCEAEGFRRITFFPDRPDVLSIYRVRMQGDAQLYPVLLSNGNCVARGQNKDDGTHWAQWHDPWPKPSYLFALVAGDLVPRRDSFTTGSGREVELAIWVREQDINRTDHAMQSLVRAMQWDEASFGREYDLDCFNIVAVSDFNMGAMENKGLNIFNTKYVLADRDTASDTDFDAVEGVIGHEYFHNWSGNRVTCRDWFQLSLKEGFTVLRDQLFSQDMGNVGVRRIEDVRILRAAQFPEDSGPLAHPIRPDSFHEISNFYTATIYNKGAEVVRMIRTMAGEERFRAACDLYFDRHDGEAATCEDFISAMEDGTGLDLTRFRLWYGQAGTPRLTISLGHNGANVRVHVQQKLAPTPGQAKKHPMPIPLRLALFDRDSRTRQAEQTIVLDGPDMTLDFQGFDKPPILSVNRDFSAPVIIEQDVAPDELFFLACHDDDPFARWEAMQDLVTKHIISAQGEETCVDSLRESARIITDAMEFTLQDHAIDDEMRGELMALPGFAALAEHVPLADPLRISAAREALKADIGAALSDALCSRFGAPGTESWSMTSAARGTRKMRGLALTFLAASDPDRAAQLAAKIYLAADNITDRQNALWAVAGLEAPQRQSCLQDFYRHNQDNPLVVDKWFAIQASSNHPQIVHQVQELAQHKDFTLHNPNRVRSLYMTFAANPVGFHAQDGAGYRMIGDLVTALDPINAQTAARFVPALGRWKRIEPHRARLMRAQLERISRCEGLSADTREQVEKALA
ncbi:MAG: aminopeptidase N [Sphingomonadaceae bacterium]